jgi:hypothetical protein
MPETRRKGPNMLVVLGTSPVVDVTIAVGPFRSETAARAAAEELISKGYTTETCPLWSVADVDASDAWDGD